MPAKTQERQTALECCYKKPTGKIERTLPVVFAQLVLLRSFCPAGLVQYRGMLMSMNRSLSARLLAVSAAACLSAAFAVSAPAQILHHTKKPRKVSSADPLAGVTSKQPD